MRYVKHPRKDTQIVLFDPGEAERLDVMIDRYLRDPSVPYSKLRFIASIRGFLQVQIVTEEGIARNLSQKQYEALLDFGLDPRLVVPLGDNVVRLERYRRESKRTGGL